MEWAKPPDPEEDSDNAELEEDMDRGAWHLNEDRVMRIKKTFMYSRSHGLVEKSMFIYVKCSLTVK